MQCTWHALIGKGGQEEFNRNPRKVWYYNLQEVTTNGDLEATFHLQHPQPSFLMLLASGFSPVYPCHVSQRDMRTKPIGTGPFKLVELQRNVGIKFVRNPDYWKKGKPYVDAIEMRIIDSRSTRILAFVSGEFDMTFDRDITVPLLKDVRAQAPKAICQLGPYQRQHQPGRELRRPAVRQPADPPGDGAGARSQGLHRHPLRGQGQTRRRHAAGPGGPVGAAAGGAGQAAGLRRRRRRRTRTRRARSWPGSATARASP